MYISIIIFIIFWTGILTIITALTLDKFKPIDQKKKLFIWKSSFAFLNFFLILHLVGSLFIYTSLFRFVPWYEPCGQQFLIIFIYVTIILLLGILQFFLSKFLEISKILKLLPFISIIALSAPILIDGSLSLAMRITGIVICLLLICSVIIFFINDFKKIHSNEIKNQNQ